MVRTRARSLRVMALGVTGALLVAACGGSTPSAAPVTTGPVGTGVAPASEAPTGPQKGGTIYLLNNADNWTDVDPSRVYTGEDLAFFGATIYRALESFVYDADPVKANVLAPDLATDTGTATNEGKTWAFTLRDGVTWQDGSELNCADVAYGVSRAFATDVMGGGPSYQIQYLDIPADGYPGPYTATPEQQAVFDKAVSCTGKTITFQLNKPVGDFNQTTTLGFFPVPNPVDHPGVDIGEGYGVTTPPWSNGPYMVESYTPGKGGSMVLVRNENWNPESDEIRTDYPDKWEVQFGIDPKIMDTRLMDPSGVDEFAIQYGGVEPENLSRVFADSLTPTAEFEGRAISGFDPYSRYFWIDINLVPNLKHRQAIGAALDREAARTVLGGDFYGELGDGVIKPNIGQDYAPTGYYTDLFGAPIAPGGSPDFAKQLIVDSGEPMPELTWNYADTDVGDQYFAVIQSSLAEAGIIVNPGALPSGDYYKVVFDTENELRGQFGNAGWGPDWPNASTVIAPLFTQVGGWDLSQVDVPAYNAGVQDALTTLDRTAQAAKWAALNKEAMLNVYAIPTFFGLSQTLAGTKVGPIYRWGPYGSWPYGIMYVEQ